MGCFLLFFAMAACKWTVCFVALWLLFIYQKKNKKKVRGRGGDEEEISHLLFVDDTLVSGGPKEAQFTHSCWILMQFEALSGLKVNVKKVRSSQLAGWTTLRSWHKFLGVT